MVDWQVEEDWESRDWHLIERTKWVTDHEDGLLVTVVEHRDEIEEVHITQKWTPGIFENTTVKIDVKMLGPLLAALQEVQERVIEQEA